MKVSLYIDGAARGNPGPAGIGVVIKKGNELLLEVADYIGKTTNNVAEYLALIRGLEESLLLGATEVEVHSDSELLVKQINGEYRVKNEGLIPLHYQAQTLTAKLKKFTITHKLRAENKHADELANKGIDNRALGDAANYRLRLFL